MMSRRRLKGGKRKSVFLMILLVRREREEGESEGEVKDVKTKRSRAMSVDRVEGRREKGMKKRESGGCCE